MNSDDDENADDLNHENGRSARTAREKNLDNNHQGFYEFTFRRFFDDGGYPLDNYPFSANGSTENPDPFERPPAVCV